jgi:hypothetical protein
MLLLFVVLLGVLIPVALLVVRYWTTGLPARLRRRNTGAVGAGGRNIKGADVALLE